MLLVLTLCNWLHNLVIDYTMLNLLLLSHHVWFTLSMDEEKLMRENSIVDEELDVNDSNIYLELEDLITKPTDWSVGSASGLVEQTSWINLTSGIVPCNW